MLAPEPRVRTLANGVTVICDPVPGFATLALSVVAGRGARFEDEARAGWSHLLEHMVFKGAGGRSARDIVEVIEAAGGHINAVTGQERTSFQVRSLAGGLDLASAVIADLMLRPALDPDELTKEKRIVAQEIAEAVDTPDDQVFELAAAAAFAAQPLGRPVLGTSKSLEGAVPEKLEAWRARLYAPDRLVVSAAGAVDEDDLALLAESRFGAAPAPAPAKADRAQFTGGEAVEKRRLEQAHLVFLLPAAAATDPDLFAIRLFSEILGGGMSSRLFQKAREELGLAYAIDAFFEAFSDVGFVGVYAGCAAADAARLAELVGKEIAALGETVAEAELARAKAQLKSGLFMSAESLPARAEQAAYQHLVFGRLLSHAEIGARIDAIDREDLARVGKRLTASGASAVAALGPGGGREAAVAFREAAFG
ncbi:MAG TPA: pitrilysin family protein [Caulobacteraceae bacterium]|nr:pitrilysin family protein [Caulobacteraceae bacterium]